jgi:hypothetical protein
VSNPAPDTEPTPDEVLQHEDTPSRIAPVPVTVEGPTRVQPLPATVWNTRHYTTSDANAIQVATSNPKRARILLQTFSKNHWIGESQAKARTGVGMIVPGGGNREFFHTGEIWAIVAETAGSDGLSVAEEYWTS